MGIPVLNRVWYSRVATVTKIKSSLYVTRGITPKRVTSIGGQYRGTFLVPLPVPSVLWKKSTGTAVPVLLLFNFTWYSEILQNLLQQKRSLHNYTFHSNRLKDLFLKYNTAMPSSAAIERFFSTKRDILKPKRSWSFRVRRPFPNGFVFEIQLRVKVFQ